MIIVLITIVLFTLAALFGLQQFLRFLRRRQVNKDHRFQGEITPAVVLQMVAGNSPNYGTPVDGLTKLRQLAILRQRASACK
jgi:hypothetical protein